VKKRLILFSLVFLFLTFIISPLDWNKFATKTYSADSSKLCSFILGGSGNIDGVPYVLPSKDLQIYITGGKPNMSGLKNASDSIEFKKEGDTYNSKANITLPIITDGQGNGNLKLSVSPDKHFGVYTTNYDKYFLFPDCPNGVSPNHKTFYLFRKHEYGGTESGLSWLITPNDPPKNDDTRISIYIVGVENLRYDPDKNTHNRRDIRIGGDLGSDYKFNALMVKAHGTHENRGNDPGFTGSFASQSGGSLYSLDDGDGDICDDNPHPPYKGSISDDMQCVEAANWGKNDFLRPVLSSETEQKIAEITGVTDLGVKRLDIKGICENMEGIRSGCDAPFEEKVPYEFAIYGIYIPPTKGTEEGTKVEEDDKIEKDPCLNSKDKVEDTYSNPHIDVDTCDVYGPLVANGVQAIFTFTPEKADSAAGYFQGDERVHTPFGDITVSPAGIAQAVLSLALGAGGGIAFLLMVFGSYRLIFSAGNPMAVQQGREVITAAVVGLLVILFSVFILRLFGIGILGLPIG
jgi:hypothetical protein